MEPNLSKLFIGGISWDTDEFRLKEYFEQFGEVVESVIMKDRITGRARGFGFVVFSNPKAAERVVMEKHIIDGRKVEAKKAVPREYQHILSRNSNAIHGSPGTGHSRKIFVGGLASTVTESDFKKYFDQFGTITDVVVMYDQNTRRPRGFGFITYDSEDAVSRVLYKTFHELNGKMVEVKRAVPKELSPSPIRSPLIRYNSYGLDRSSNLINIYPQGYGFNSVGGGYGRSNSVSGGREGFGSIGASRYGVNMNMVPFFGGNYGPNPGFGNTPGGLLSPQFSGHVGRFNSPIGYGGSNARDDSLFSSVSQNVWGSGSSNNPTNPGVLLGSGSGNFGAMFGNNRSDWVSSRMMSQGGGGGGNASGYNNGTPLGYGLEDRNHSLGNQGYGRISDSSTGITQSLSGLSSGLDSPYGGDSYRGSFAYGGDSTGRNPELENSGLFNFGLGDGASYGNAQTSEGYIEGYTVANRQPNRGIAA